MKTISMILTSTLMAIAVGLLRDGQVIQQGAGQDIVLNPADDYVANFVQHVDRGKVVQVASVMEPLGINGIAPGIMVKSDVTLTDAMQQMMSRDMQYLEVQDRGGKPVGRLSLERAISVAAGAA